MSADASGFERGAGSRFELRPWIRVAAFTVIAVLLLLKLLGYAAPEGASVKSVVSIYSSADARVQSFLRNAPYLHDCGPAQKQLTVSGGYVCGAGRPNNTVYNTIFQTYPAGPDGRNYVYDSTTTGTVAVADHLLEGIVDVPRYASAKIGTSPTWREDPFHAVYWRLNYYALRPTQSLLSAYVETGDAAYAKRLIALDKSFFAHSGSETAPAWKDPHAVAFRAMVLVNQWWRLRQYHQLTEADSGLYLRELERTGQYLADPNHYEPGYNHGTNEAAALLDLALNFPTLPHADEWLALSRQRLTQSMNDLVDGDGALIENSPYYHFYTLDKYWQILRFADRFGLEISPNFRARLDQMIGYATYILEPDLSVPLLGASLQSTVHAHGSFAQMAEADPALEYVLTQGAHGTRPAHTSVALTHTGQTIMRSGWGSGASFQKQSFLTFNVGAYRTPHSHLDMLGITLYGNGTQLLSDAGLYTYAPGKLHDYFHGTSAHNTVVVDGKDQAQGSGSAGTFAERDGVTYQTGTSELYLGVTHRRMVMMVDRTHFLVVDRLSSKARHSYQQMFHLAPGARVSRDGLTITGHAQNGSSITIRQLDTQGITASVTSGQRSPAMGLCSLQYGKAVACPAIAYRSVGRDARFTTLLTIGKPDPGFTLAYDPSATGALSIKDGARSLELRLGETSDVPTIAHATNAAPPKPVGVEPLPGSQIDAAGWTTGTGAAVPAVHSHGRSALRLAASPTGESTLVNDGIRADLSKRNLQLTLRVERAAALGGLELQLSNDHWRTTITNNLRDGYSRRYAGEWLTLSLGRAQPSSALGPWTSSGTFDWSRVDGVRLVLERSNSSRQLPLLEVAGIASMPQQARGAVTFVFDDGYSSILPAAQYMRNEGMAGNVAVISKYTALPTQGHLTVHDLHHLQDAWGWDMVNHTQSHTDAVSGYWPGHQLDLYEKDIVGGARFLEQAGLNSAPNWLIYPHGSTNAGLERVVRRYYRFARTTDSEPEAYPFGDPLRVKTLEVGSATDSENGGEGAFTTPQQVLDAVRDAKTFHTTVILTFHRIHARASDRPGYPIGPFRQIVDGIAKTGIEVTTLSGLDALNGVPQDNRIVVEPGTPSQITVKLREHSSGGGALGFLGGLF